MKKTFVSALAVLNFMFAFAQEDNVVIENQSVGTEPVSVSQNQSKAEVQPAQSVAVQINVNQPITNTQQSVQKESYSSTSVSSDDFDSDFFASNNVSSGRDGEFKNVFGLRFGYSSSKVASLGVYTGSVSGFTFGVVDQIWFGESNVFAEVGAFFNQKGYSLKDFEPSETKLNYIEVPAMVCHRIGRESLSITAKAGGYIAMGLSGTLKTFVSEDPAAIDLFRDEHKYDVFKEGSLSRFDAGVRFGLAVVIRKVMLGCRYDLGLYDISKKDIIYGDDNLMLGYKNLKNRCFQILMGFNFR